MKRVLIIVVLIAGLILIACENQKNDFPDFDYTTGYFPYQYPIRTLVLGDYIYDNTNDNNHKFLISADFGGVYENKEERVFDIEVDPTLCNNVLFASSKDTIRMMPASYYSLSSNKIVIPAGKFYGSVEVQLTDAFFDDPLAIKLNYVVPVRILNATNVDSVLSGKVSTTYFGTPDPRRSADWATVPKDFTMFAVNFINPYHGTYLHRGANTVKNASSAVVETNVYRTKYIVNNELWSLVTSGKNQVNIVSSTHSTLVPGNLNMNLTFSDDVNCSITQATGSTYTITGSGKFMTDADTWGNKNRDAIYLNYQITSGVYTYNATDTLVVRDRAVTLQTYTPTVFVK